MLLSLRSGEGSTRKSFYCEVFRRVAGFSIALRNAKLFLNFQFDFEKIAREKFLSGIVIDTFKVENIGFNSHYHRHFKMLKNNRHQMK